MTIKKAFKLVVVMRQLKVVRMNFFAIFFISCLLEIVNGNKKDKSEDLSSSCIIRFLQIKGKLEDSFPSSYAPGDLCRVLLPLIYTNHSEKLVLKLYETKNVKARCVYEKLKNSEFIEHELKLEIFSQAKHLTMNEKRKREYEVMINQRKLLIDTARICRSDAKYGGIFDEILGMNSSLTLLQESYCYQKYVIDNRFLNIPAVQLGSDAINVECRIVVETKKRNSERKLTDAFHKNHYSRAAIDCLLEKYRHEQIFGWNLAKELLTKLEFPPNVRLMEEMRISKKISEFNDKSTNCLFSFNWELFQ
jgi:hypothetical protein